MIDPALTRLLVCPEDRSPLQEADAELIERLNRRVAERTLRNRAGEQVERPLGGGLIGEDGRRLYPIFDGIPVLLADQAIDVADPR